MEKPTPNEKQQICINETKGKHLVLAGPGTGKTFTMIHRLKKILSDGVEPDKILCLTFSDAAANEMKKKITEFFGNVELGVNIYTYHSFCNEIIGENAEEFELPENYRIISPTISKQFLKECIDERIDDPTLIGYRNKKNDPYVYMKIIYDKIGEIKEHRLTKSQYMNSIKTNPNWQPELDNLIKEKNELDPSDSKNAKKLEKLEGKIEDQKLKIKKAQEIWEFYESYKNKMEEEHYIDFDDMIGFVLQKFEDSPAFLDKIANKYEYIMVDEYQDTNKMQNQIVFKLAHALKSENVFVVGDDDQIIFSFQGASLDTIENYIKEFPDTKVHCLTNNLRSTQNILDVARNVIEEDTRRLEKNSEFSQYNIDKTPLSSNPDLEQYKNEKVRCTKYFNVDQERLDIVTEIDKLINSDNCPTYKGEKRLCEIAVIATNNDDLAIYAQMLKDRNIPFEIKDGKSIFKIKSSIILYYYLQMLVNPELYSDSLYKLLLLPPFNIDAQDYVELHKVHSKDNSFIESLRNIKNPKNKIMINKFLSDYDYLKKYSADETVRNIVLETGARTGIFNEFLNCEINKEENIAALKKFVDVAEEFSQTHKQISLEEFVDYLITTENDNDLDILTDKAPVPLNAVQLMTYHSSKGHEYEYVYLPTLQSSRWESKGGSLAPTIPVPIDEYKDKDEWSIYKKSDLIKTLYVGITRAKHTLRLSYVNNYGKKATYPSKWILKSQNLMKMVDKSEFSIEDHLKQEINNLFKRPYDYKRDFKLMIDRYLKDKYHSPSAINNYLSCPRMYFYENILKFESNAEIPDYMNYGSAVHNACEYLVKEAKTRQAYPSKEEYINKFYKELDAQAISTKEQRKIFKQRGTNELDKFYHHMTDFPISSIVAAEQWLEGEYDGMKFRGKIDRIDRSEDGSHIISDYKTGEPKNKDSICLGGKSENYYYQICLYKFFYEKIKKIPVNTVQFLFPMNGEEPLSFDPTDEECAVVIQNFKNAIKGIENCEFEPTDNKQNCERCSYKTFCQFNIV